MLFKHDKDEAIKSVCSEDVKVGKSGKPVPSFIADGMANLIDPNFFSISDKKYWDNGNFLKDVYADEHRVLDTSCNSGVLLEKLYYRFIGSLSECFDDDKELDRYVLTELIYAFVPDERLLNLLRRKLYWDDRCLGNIFHYNILTHTGTDSDIIQIVNNKVIIGGKALKFNVVISNPPYQDKVANINGAAVETYSQFVEIARDLSSEYVVMIIPARWYGKARGKNIKSFRDWFLSCNHIVEMHDFPNSDNIFPGICLTGGLVYFLYSKSYTGECLVYSYDMENKLRSKSLRKLKINGIDEFVRDYQAVSILNKVVSNSNFTSIVSETSPFGLQTNCFDEYDKDGSYIKYYIKEFSKSPTGYADEIKVYGSFGRVRYLPDKSYLPVQHKTLNKYKVFATWANSCMYADKFKIETIIGKPNDACTLTYVTIGDFDTEEEASNCVAYMSTNFFRFLVFIQKSSQHLSRGVYSFVPLVDFSQAWTDEMLFDKFNLTEEERNYIINTMSKSKENN